jgi:hypothetical protein
MTLPVLMMIMDGMFREIALDLPKSSQVVNEHERLMQCVESLEQDLIQAVSLPQTHGAWQQNETTLLIQLPEILVAYVHDDRGLSREVIDPEDPEANRSWPMPEARMVWTLLPDLVQPTRVEVSTAVLQARRKKQQLKNGRIFYVGVDRVQGGL